VDWIGLLHGRDKWRALGNLLAGQSFSGCTSGGLSCSGQRHRVELVS
jgi:hypothetical protein